MLILWGSVSFFLVLPSLCMAADYHALLIGVGGTGKPLLGPKNDVPALRDMLVDFQGFSPENITTLVEEEATRDAILREIDNLGTRSRPGDLLFLYFSGHGTSLGDSSGGARLDLPHESGALVPFDARLHGKYSDILASLIVGRRDLVPRIKKLEKERLVLAVFDACYSQYSVRSMQKMAASRYTPIYIDDNTLPAITEITGGLSKTSARTPYPYTNVFYISASSEDQKAWDLGHCGKASTSVDGLPHGLLTDQLLRVLRGGIAADSNHDGDISFGELFDSIKKPTVAISSRYCESVSTPHALPENDGLQSRSFFRSAAKPASVAAPSSVSSLAEIRYPRQSFNVSVDFSGKYGDTVTVGDIVSYSMYTEKDAWLLLFAIGPDGLVNVIYPYYPRELVQVKAKKTILLKNLGVVVGPAGKETIILIGFQKKPRLFESLMAQENIRPGSATYRNLTEMLGLQNNNTINITALGEIAQYSIEITSVLPEGH